MKKIIAIAALVCLVFGTCTVNVCADSSDEISEVIRDSGLIDSYLEPEYYTKDGEDYYTDPRELKGSKNIPLYTANITESTDSIYDNLSSQNEYWLVVMETNKGFGFAYLKKGEEYSIMKEKIDKLNCSDEMKAQLLDTVKKREGKWFTERIVETRKREDAANFINDDYIESLIKDAGITNIVGMKHININNFTPGVSIKTDDGEYVIMYYVGKLNGLENNKVYALSDFIERYFSDDLLKIEIDENETTKEQQKSDEDSKSNEDKEKQTDKKDAKEDTKSDEKENTKTDVKEETKTEAKDDIKSETKDTETQKPTKLNTTEKADELKSKGLFKGTDSGYELDKTLTRAEGATMLVRLLGKEQDAQGGTYDEVFSDSPSGAWYYDSVMYAYKNGIIRGTSDTTFTPDRTMSAKEFTALVMRALGKEDTQPENSLAEAAKLNLITGKTVTELENKGTFTRGDMVDIAYAAYKYSNGK